MAYMTADYSDEIKKILFEFEEEMSKIEVPKLFAALFSGNPPTAQKNLVSQRQEAIKERQDALRRVLCRVFGMEEQQEQLELDF